MPCGKVNRISKLQPSYVNKFEDEHYSFRHMAKLIKLREQRTNQTKKLYEQRIKQRDKDENVHLKMLSCIVISKAVAKLDDI